MTPVADYDLREFVVSSGSFGPQEIEQLGLAVSKDVTLVSILRDSVAELETIEERSPATSVRLGVCQYLLGRFTAAADTLARSDGSALAYFFLGKAQIALEQYGEAVSSFDASKRAGYNADQCFLAIAEIQRCSGRADEALGTLDGLFGPIEQTAEYLYQRGATVLALGGNPDEVVALMQRAVEVDDDHPGALFGLAMENDRRGNDDDALRLYQRAAARYPTHVGSLLNLGLLYEDRQDYERARSCYQRILDVYPTDPRAKLYYKDAQASGDMYYDEEIQKQRDRLSQVLAIPVTDFELSVRSRNCLQKMGIFTLGDLTRCTEAELLASKNFGETSLVEIRDMLESKGLDLGQFSHERSEPEPEFEPEDITPDQQVVLERPISELNLSVRARKCMVRLGLNTIGELARKSQDDLLECKNFGVTSLNEVREKLQTFSLKLRGD